MKPSRPLAFAALVLTCVLLPAGSFFHEHDEGDAAGGDHHHCVVGCPHHAAIASSTAPTASTPEPAARASASTRCGVGQRTALDVRPTRGPPA